MRLPRHPQFDEEMFCQRDEVYDHPSHSSVSIHLMSKSYAREQMQRKHKTCHTVPKAFLVDKFLETKPSDQEDVSIGHESHKSKCAGLKLHRYRLEKDVFRLQKQLQQELDLHYALESAFGHAAGAFPKFPRHLPVDAQELLADIAMLEVAVSNLEEQMVALNLQLGCERRERQNLEHRLIQLPRQFKEQARQITESPVSSIEQTGRTSNSSPSTSEKSFNWSPNALCSGQHHCFASSIISTQVQPPSLRTPDSLTPICSAASGNNLSDAPSVFLLSPNKQCPSGSFYSGDECRMQVGSLVNCSRLEGEAIWLQPSLLSPEKLKFGKQSALSNSSFHEDMSGRLRTSDIRNSWEQPNRLSQEMVSCMISIYCHLADPAETLSTTLPLQKIPSPTSPFGHATSSSLSSLSESSLLSFTRSPPVDLHNKELGTESTFDPYRIGEKLPWADIGNYNTAIEVSEMCVGKEQLEYAAEALRMFRSLVEQLSRVDPSTMRHEEKLAFWINVYNALMMHAYLAYGVPKSDFKFFSLMQKAAYTVGGHSFNAVVIEQLLLKGKAPGYRPQIALLLAHQKLKLTEEVSIFAIDQVEPLVTFGLSFGASSSPAVRVYTAENVHGELQAAQHDYIRASVGISAKGKLLVPKLLHSFARDLVEESVLLDWICQFLPCSQASLIQNCLQHRQHRFLNSKNWAVIPFDFRFRYLFLLEKLPPIENHEH